jgi:hypothetical protein
MRVPLRDEIRSRWTAPERSSPFRAALVFVWGVAAWEDHDHRQARGDVEGGGPTTLPARRTLPPRPRAARGLGERSAGPFHRGVEGTDPSAVLTDALPPEPWLGDAVP